MKKEKATPTVAKSVSPNIMHKDSDFAQEIERIYTAFYGEFKTALQVVVELDIPLSEVRSQIKTMIREGLLLETFRRPCPITNCYAQFYTAEERKEGKDE